MTIRLSLIFFIVKTIIIIRIVFMIIKLMTKVINITIIINYFIVNNMIWLLIIMFMTHLNILHSKQFIKQVIK